MTITATSVSPNEYTASGSQATFAYTFQILDDDDLLVYLDDVLQASGYEVTDVGDPAGGNVRFIDGESQDNPPSVGAKVKLKRSTPVSQLRAYTYPATTHEDALDKLTLILQEIKYEIEQLQS